MNKIALIALLVVTVAEMSVARPREYATRSKRSRFVFVSCFRRPRVKKMPVEKVELRLYAAI